jgi:hypothetical protein
MLNTHVSKQNHHHSYDIRGQDMLSANVFTLDIPADLKRR